MRALRIYSRPNQQGLSMVELMVAMTLGLFLTYGVIQAFLSGKQAYTTQAALARVQENARIAQELIGADIRNAGDYGCGSGDDFLLYGSDARYGDAMTASCNSTTGPGGSVAINMLGNNFQGQLGANYSDAVYGFDNVVAGFNGYGFTLDPAPIPGTDVLLVRVSQEVGTLDKPIGTAAVPPYVLKNDVKTNGLGSPNLTITPAVMTVPSATTGLNIALQQGEVIAMSNCALTKIWAIGSNTLQGSTTFQISDPALSGNNYCTRLAAPTGSIPSDYDPTLSPFSPQIGQNFPMGSSIRKLINVYYYIALNADKVPSLYRQRVTNLLQPTNNPKSEELLEGIENMQIQYGVESAVAPPNTMVPTNYYDASKVTEAMWNGWDAGYCAPVDNLTCFHIADLNHDMLQTVRSVRYSLLIADRSQPVLTGTNQSYLFPAWGSTLTTSTDGYLRQVIVNTVGLRVRVRTP